MKRTPCCLAISPSSCGSMMTRRDLSYSKCRSISGSVPLPIEPKPIMTMGPEIFAWICAAGGGFMGLSPELKWDQAARRLVVTSGHLPGPYRLSLSHDERDVTLLRPAGDS